MASGKIQKSSDAIMQDVIGNFIPSQRSTWQTFNLQEPIKDDAIYTLNVHVDSGYSGYGFTAKGSVLKSVNAMMHPFHLVDDVPRSDATALYACFPSDSEFSLYVASGLWEGLNVGVRIIKIYDEIPTTYVPYAGQIDIRPVQYTNYTRNESQIESGVLRVYIVGKLVTVFGYVSSKTLTGSGLEFFANLPIPANGERVVFPLSKFVPGGTGINGFGEIPANHHGLQFNITHAHVNYVFNFTYICE